MMRKQINSWQTVLWWELVQNVATKKHTVTNAKNVVSTLNATDLINPKSTITGETPIFEINKTLVFAFGSLRRFLERMDSCGHKNDWKPNVYGQVNLGLMADWSLAP